MRFSRSEHTAYLAEPDSVPACTPPAKNDAAASLAAPAVSEPGVCTHRNASSWHQIAEFLEPAYIARLREIGAWGAEREERRGPACGEEPR